MAKAKYNMIVGTPEEVFKKTLLRPEFSFLYKYDPTIVRGSTSKESIDQDLNRINFVSLNEKTYDDMKTIWKNSELDYTQGIMDGSGFSGFMFKDYRKQKHDKDLETDPNADPMQVLAVSFSYFDDNGTPCGFSLLYFPNSPFEWCAAVTSNTAGKIGDRKITLFTSNHIPMREGESTFIGGDKVFNKIGYAVNSTLIKNFIADIIKLDGSVNLGQAEEVRKKLHTGKNIEITPSEVSIRHKFELSQMLAALIKAPNNTPEEKELKTFIESSLKEYSEKVYETISKNPIIQQLDGSYKSLTSREIELLLIPNDFDRQNTQVLHLLDTCMDKKLKQQVRTLLKQIHSIKKGLILIGTGLTEASLTKELTLLVDLLLNPSEESFKNIEDRINIHSEAYRKRKLAGNVATGVGTALLTGAGLTATFLVSPIVVPAAVAAVVVGSGLTVAGLFAKGQGKTRGNLAKDFVKTENAAKISLDEKGYIQAKLNAIIDNANIRGESRKSPNRDPLLLSLKTHLENPKITKNALRNLLAETIQKLRLESSSSVAATELSTLRDELRNMDAGFEQKVDPEVVKNTFIEQLEVIKNKCVSLQLKEDFGDMIFQSIDNKTVSILGHVDNILSTISGFLVTYEDESKEGIPTDLNALIKNYKKSITFNEDIDKIAEAATSRGPRTARDKIINDLKEKIKNVYAIEEKTTFLDDAIFALLKENSNSDTAQDLIKLRSKLEGENINTLSTEKPAEGPKLG